MVEFGEFSVRTGPPRVRLVGRDGVGKTVLCGALRARGIEAHGDGPADAVLYCIAGGVRDTDRVRIEAFAAEPTPVIVAWTKADAAGSWREADAYAERLAQVLGQPVIAVMALLDALPVDDLPAVRRLAASPLALPDSAVQAAALLGDDAPLLRRWGGYGLACGIGALRERPELSDADLLANLRELGGVDALMPPLAAAFADCDERREAQLNELLATVAQTDCARRDRAEGLLLDRLAAAP